MLGENIKIFRKIKGISQEELASALNVVRQTVSKWENGTSIPDSEMLVRLARELDTTVNALLGETDSEDGENEEIRALKAELAKTHEATEKRSEKQRKIVRAVFIALGVFAILMIARLVTEHIAFLRIMKDMASDETVIGGFDGPSGIYVTSVKLEPLGAVVAAAAALISGIGLFKTRKK